MKFFYIVNPTSGKRRKVDRMVDDIREASGRAGVDFDVYFTTGAGDCGRFVKEVCGRYEGQETVRIYGCGGDGTLNEIVNACAGHDDVEVGMIPAGTGNDYIRNYGKLELFRDISAQINGAAVFSDAIRYKSVDHNKIMEGYCANMFNIGFDCNVVYQTQTVKNIPLIKGPLAYLVSVGIMLVKKEGADLRIEYEDGRVMDGRILLAAIANGCYCGGGVKGVPYSDTSDGLMDVSVIKDVTRTFFLRLFPSYKKGTHMESSLIKGKDIISYSKERSLKISSNTPFARLCNDGEITEFTEVEFSMVKNAFKFIIPLQTG